MEILNGMSCIKYDNGPQVSNNKVLNKVLTK